jgi:hypothetical protein
MQVLTVLEWDILCASHFIILFTLLIQLVYLVLDGIGELLWVVLPRCCITIYEEPRKILLKQY